MVSLGAKRFISLLTLKLGGVLFSAAVSPLSLLFSVCSLCCSTEDWCLELSYIRPLFSWLERCNLFLNFPCICHGLIKSYLISRLRYYPDIQRISWGTVQNKGLLYGCLTDISSLIFYLYTPFPFGDWYLEFYFLFCFQFFYNFLSNRYAIVLLNFFISGLLSFSCFQL